MHCDIDFDVNVSALTPLVQDRQLLGLHVAGKTLEENGRSSE